MSAVAPGEVRSFALRAGAALALHPCDDAVAAIFEVEELGAAFHLYAGAAKMLDEKPLVLILWKHEDKWERAQPLPDVGKIGATHVLAPRPKVDGGKLEPRFDHVVR